MAGFLDTLESLVGIGSGLFNIFETSTRLRPSDEEVALSRELAATSAQQRRLAAAAADPDSPEYQKLYGQLRSRLGERIVEGALETQRHLRRQRKSGYGDAIRSSRRDEGISNAIINAFHQGDRLAQQATSELLTQAAGGVGTSTQGTASALEAASGLRQRRGRAFSTQVGAARGTISNIIKLFRDDEFQSPSFRQPSSFRTDAAGRILGGV